MDSVYTDLEVIGNGGGGIVYKAYHRNLQKYVVLKQIKADTFAAEDVRHEVDLLKNLKHTYLPSVIDFITDEDKQYTVMDFIEGTDLSEFVKSKKLKTEDIIRFSRQLCEAACYLHSQNPPIIHSDIKPQNIMITPKGDICLIDFNISQKFNKNNRILLGTPGYAAPEQVGYFNNKRVANNSKKDAHSASYVNINATEYIESGRTEYIDDNATEYIDSDRTEYIDELSSPEYSLDETEKIPDSDKTEYVAENDYTEFVEDIDNSITPSDNGNSGGIVSEKSDIYSVGAVMYFMITGERPNTDFKRIKSVRGYRRNIPEGLYIITEKAMAIEPVKRYSSANSMLNAIANIMKLDTRYRMLKLQRVIVSIACFLGLTAAAITVKSGFDTVSDERMDRYYEYIDEAEANIKSDDFEKAEEVIQAALSYMPDMAEAFYEKLHLYYEQGEYEICIDYYQNHSNVFEINNFELKGNMYYLVGNAYLELERYKESVIAYENALRFNYNSSECYVDLAISYSRLSNIEEAETALNKAEAVGAENDSVMLAKAELNSVKGDFEIALTNLEEAARITTDDYKLYRMLNTYSNICMNNADAIMNSHIRAADFIGIYEARVSTKYIDYVDDMIASHYMAAGKEKKNVEYFNKAVEYYEKLMESPIFYESASHSCCDIMIWELKDYQGAFNLLDKLNNSSDGDYWVMMNYAFAHIGYESTKEKTDRSYLLAYDYYQKAKELYKQYSKNGKNDPEMDTLEQYIQQLKEGNWL